MKTRKHVVSGVVSACVVLTSGCVKLWKESTDIKTYMVQVERAGSPRKVARPGLLWIDEVTVLPPYNTRNLVVRQNDVEFSTTYYSELLLSPSDNFRNNIFAWFSASGLFDDVSMTRRSGMTFRLAATVSIFLGDMEAGQAMLRIKVELIDEKAKGTRVVLSKDYEKQTAVAEYSADELIRAFDKALLQVLTECEEDVMDALRNE